MIVRTCVCALLIGVAGIASAQTQPAAQPQQPATQAQQPQLTPERRAALQKQNQELAQYADSIATMIDKGQAAQAWDQASDVAKQATPRDQFVKAIEADRAKAGSATSRKVAAITRAASNGKDKLPPGMYINVNFATQFSKETKPLRELVSFHLDQDKKWRLSGYKLYVP